MKVYYYKVFIEENQRMLLALPRATGLDDDTYSTASSLDDHFAYQHDTGGKCLVAKGIEEEISCKSVSICV
jgi:hypothetical protein